MVVGAAQANKDLSVGSETLRLTELLLFVLLETHWSLLVLPEKRDLVFHQNQRQGCVPESPLEPPGSAETGKTLSKENWSDLTKSAAYKADSIDEEGQ